MCPMRLFQAAFPYVAGRIAGMGQFSLKRLMLALTCFCATCAFTSWVRQNITGINDMGTQILAVWAICAGFGASLGVVFGRVWVGFVATVVVFFRTGRLAGPPCSTSACERC